MCRELKGKQPLAAVLHVAHSEALKAYTDSEQEDDFRELLDPPHIQGKIIKFILKFYLCKLTTLIKEAILFKIYGQTTEVNYKSE